MGRLGYVKRVNDSCNIVIGLNRSARLGMGVWEDTLLLSG